MIAARVAADEDIPSAALGGNAWVLLSQDASDKALRYQATRDEGLAALLRDRPGFRGL